MDKRKDSIMKQEITALIDRLKTQGIIIAKLHIGVACLDNSLDVCHTNKVKEDKAYINNNLELLYKNAIDRHNWDDAEITSDLLKMVALAN